MGWMPFNVVMFAAEPRVWYCQLNKTGFGECPLSGVSENLSPASWPLSSAETPKNWSLWPYKSLIYEPSSPS